MTSYSDAPLNLKEIKFKLNNYADILRRLQAKNEADNETFTNTQKAVDTSANNEVVLMFNKSLFVKQHITTTDESGIVKIDNVDYNIKSDYYCQIVAGVDRVLMLTLLSTGFGENIVYYIGYKEGLYYGNMLKWADEFKLITSATLASDIIPNTPFQCVYNQVRNSFYLITSKKYEDNVVDMLLLEYMPSNTDSWDWQIVSNRQISEDPGINLLYHVSIIKFNEDLNIGINKIFPQGALLVGGCDKTCNKLVCYLGFINYNSISVWVQLNLNNINVKYLDFDYCILEHYTEDENNEYFKLAIVAVGYKPLLFNMSNTGKIYTILEVNFNYSSNYSLNINSISNGWNDIVLSDIDETYFRKYAWKNVEYDKQHNEFVFSYCFNDNNNELLTGLNDKMITINLLPILEKVDTKYDIYKLSFKTSYTISKTHHYINIADLIFDVNRNELIAVAILPDKTIIAKERNNNLWSNKSANATIVNGSYPVSLSSCKEVNNRIYLLTTKTDSITEVKTFYVYVLAYDIVNEWVGNINNYFTIEPRVKPISP